MQSREIFFMLLLKERCLNIQILEGELQRIVAQNFVFPNFQSHFMYKFSPIHWKVNIGYSFDFEDWIKIGCVIVLCDMEDVAELQLMQENNEELENIDSEHKMTIESDSSSVKFFLFCAYYLFSY